MPWETTAAGRANLPAAVALACSQVPNAVA